MHRVEGRSAYQLQSLIEVQAVFLYVVAESLQVAKGGVALVAVVNLLLDAELLQSQCTTDSEQDFLLQSVFPLATIEGVGDGLVELRVHLVVSIQQVELDTTHVHLPEVSVNHVIHVGNLHHYGVTPVVHDALNGQGVEILCLVVSYLLSLDIERLLEISITIEETHSAEIYVAVGSLLQIIARKHSQTTRVYLQHLGESILHTEISHGRTIRIGLHVHVGAEILVDLLHALHHGLVFYNGLLACVSQSLQKQNGIMSHFLVKVFVETTEKIPGLIVPRPPKVVSQFVKTLQFLRESGFYRQLFPLGSVDIICLNLHFLNLLLIICIVHSFLSFLQCHGVSLIIGLDK